MVAIAAIGREFGIRVLMRGFQIYCLAALLSELPTETEAIF
jgi:hypothetical protein